MRSPSERSFNSATAFRTFKIRFSIRTPVCTRSISTMQSPCWYQCTMVHARTQIKPQGDGGVGFSGSCFESVEDRGAFSQVVDEPRHLFMTAVVVRGAQN